MAKDKIRHDDKFDLVLTRTIEVPRELVWKVWTEPQHVKKWFAPAPLSCRWAVPLRSPISRSRAR